MNGAEDHGLVFNADTCLINVTEITLLASCIQRKVFDPTPK